MGDPLHKSKISLSDVVTDGQGVPISMKIFSVGSNLDCRGVDAIYNVADALRIMKSNTRADGLVPIDLAHGMLAGPEAPAHSHEALGWAKLRCDATGVWLDDIKWNDETRQKLIERKFRYVSPAFTIRKVGKATMIEDVITVSLTNIPATVDAQPIVRGNQVVCRSIAQFATSTQRSHIDREQANMATKAEDKGAELEPKDDEEVVRSEDESEPAEDEGKDDGDKPDPSDVDIDSLNEAECREFAARMVDMYMDAMAAKKSRDESDKVKDEETKRSIVKALHQDRLINYNDKKPLMALSLAEVTVKERSLRKQAPASRAAVVRSAKEEQRENTHGNEVARTVNSAVTPVMGASDEDIDKFTAHLPEERRVALGLTARSQGAVYGTRIKSTESKERN